MSGPGQPSQVTDQQKYDAFMASVDLIQASSFNIANVNRGLSDCDKIAAAIQALQNFYSQYCPIA